jgi:hypothetical protein
VRHGSHVLILLLVGALLAACAGGDDTAEEPPPATTAAVESVTSTTVGPRDVCATELEDADIGITRDEITLFVMADVEADRAPHPFPGVVEAVKAWADTTNELGGLACRKVVVREWDSRMRPDHTASGIEEACEKSFAMVGTASLVVLDPTVLATCPDAAGKPTGIPDVASFAAEVPHQCNPTTFPITMADGDCPYSGGPRRSTPFAGAARHHLAAFPGLHGVHVIPADLPSTIQAGLVEERAADAVGIGNDGDVRIASRADDTAYARFAELLAERGSTYVDTVANDRTMIALRKAAAARGVTTVSVWSCGMSCYTHEFVHEGGELVEGTYVWLQFLPFDEADHSRQLAAYLDAIGGIDHATPWGATAWAAAVELGDVVARIAERDGPNAVTRARVLGGLATTADFDAEGWFAPRGQRELSDCFVLLQVRSGKFVRSFPAERGTFSCDPSNLVDVQVDPAADTAG